MANGESVTERAERARKALDALHQLPPPDPHAHLRAILLEQKRLGYQKLNIDRQGLNGHDASLIESLAYINAGEVTPKAIRWLWPGRIATGKVSLIVGDPGLGKSQVCASLASVVTNGGSWPVDRTPCEQGAVIILSAEDDPEDTIRPRLDAAGAMVQHVYILQAVKYESDTQKGERGFDLAKDAAKLGLLGAELAGKGVPVRLIVIDPVSAYLGIADSHKNAEVRALLTPLSLVAQQRQCAILLVSHLNKSQTSSALMRVQGSVAFSAAARAVWGVTKDPQNEQRRLFMPMKNNIGKDDSGLAYQIESYRLDAPPSEPGADLDPIDTSRVMWEPDIVRMHLDDAFGNGPADERNSKREAADFLRSVLADGRVLSTELQRDCEGAGHSWATIRRVAQGIGVKTEREGFGPKGRWYWSIPPTA